jgi:hypothetical protein
MTSFAKKTASVALSASILASRGAEYGLTFSSEAAKVFFGGAKNLANQFAQGAELGIGAFLYDKTEKAALWTVDQAIALQKWMKGKLRS